VNTDRVEALVIQVLEETRGFRQEVNERFAKVDERFAAIDGRLAGVDGRFAAMEKEMREGFAEVRRDIRLLQTAVLDVTRDVRRVETKLDTAVEQLDGRLRRLEGAAE
jgi:hypothetical protein